jgi:hypothetical protein
MQYVSGAILPVQPTSKQVEKLGPETSTSTHQLVYTGGFIFYTRILMIRFNILLRIEKEGLINFQSWIGWLFIIILMQLFWGHFNIFVSLIIWIPSA